MAGNVAVTAGVIALWKNPAVQEFIAEHLGDSASGVMLKALIAGAALVNLKNMPGFWHVSSLSDKGEIAG